MTHTNNGPEWGSTSSVWTSEAGPRRPHLSRVSVAVLEGRFGQRSKASPSALPDHLPLPLCDAGEDVGDEASAGGLVSIARSKAKRTAPTRSNHSRGRRSRSRSGRADRASPRRDRLATRDNVQRLPESGTLQGLAALSSSAKTHASARGRGWAQGSRAGMTPALAAVVSSTGRACAARGGQLLEGDDHLFARTAGRGGWRRSGGPTR